MSYGHAPFSAAAFSELIVSDGSVRLDTSARLPLGGSATIAAAVALITTIPLPLGGAVDLDDPVAFDEGVPERLPLGGSSTMSAAIAMSGPSAMPLGGAVVLSNPSIAPAVRPGRNRGIFSTKGIRAPTLFETKAPSRPTVPRTVARTIIGMFSRSYLTAPDAPRGLVGSGLSMAAPDAPRRGLFSGHAWTYQRTRKGLFQNAFMTAPDAPFDEEELVAMLEAVGLL